MRSVMAAMIAGSLISLAAGVTLAQVNPEEKAKSGQTQGQGQQPQGNPGNLETKGKAAPAASPQGETPPGMQSAPKGSTKSNDTK
jgi:hypothetical protein